MRKLLGWLLAAGAVAAFAQPVSAGHCGACNYPRRCVTPDQVRDAGRHQHGPVPAGVRAAPSRCATGPCTRRVHPGDVHHLPNGEGETYVAEKVAVQRPVVESFDTVRCYTVNRPVYETHLQEQTFTVMKPVTRTFQVEIPYCTRGPSTTST